MASREWLEDQVRAAVVDYNTLPDAMGTDVSAYVAAHVFDAQSERDKVLSIEYEQALRIIQNASEILDHLTDVSFEDEVAYALAVRHKCLEHAGPGSGPCKTDQERARIVLRLIAAKINARPDPQDG